MKYAPLFRLVGAALVLLGGAVMLSWRLQYSPLLEVLPDYSTMVFNTALCFALAGAALLAPLSDPARQVRFTTLLGGMLVTLAALVLAEHLFQVDLGIDWPSLHSWLRDANPRPGRMSVGTATGFLMSGVVLILATRADRAWMATAVRVLTLGVGTIGALGLAGLLVSAQLIFPRYPLAGMAIHTAAGLLLLAFGLHSAWKRFAWSTKPLFKREDDRITAVGATVLIVTTLGAGIAILAILQERVQTLVRDNLLASLTRRADVFQDLIQLREVNAQIAATRPVVLRNLRVIHAGGDDGSNIANVNAVVDGFAKQGFSAIAYSDLDGKVVARSGAFAQAPPISVTLATPGKAELLWNGGFVLRHRIPMRDAEGLVGELLAEQPLAMLTRLTQRPPGNSETWDMGVCVRHGEGLLCFPQRLNPKVFSTPLVNVSGDPLPMTRALLGEAGTIVTRDYRVQNVVAAYGPVGALGLGMVVKVDAVEVFQPIRERLQLALALLLFLVAAGTLLLRSQVRPLATRLVNALQAKDRFLTTMSHELRTPLNAIIGFTGTLLMKLPGPLNADQEKQLRTVQGSGKHLLALINDLLDLAKIEAGKIELNLEPTVCQDVIEEAVASLRPLAESKGLELLVASPAAKLVVQTDRRALSQIVLNLLNNASKFTERGSVCVALARREADGKAVIEISVQDTGVGIRPEDQARLFAAFTQVDAATRRQEGTGLGLHLSQKLAALLGGAISCRSEYGKGSTFTLQIPQP